MTLNEIKLKRLAEASASKAKKGGGKQVRRDPKTGAQIYVAKEEEDLPDSVVVEYDLDEDGNYTNARVVSEGKKKHHTPKFVQHCVSAITNDPEKLADVEKKKDGSPFAICNAQYNKDKKSLAAKHSQGKHHTVKDYENALEKLRESVEERAAHNVDPRSVSFTPVVGEQEVDPRSIRFSPWG